MSLLNTTLQTVVVRLRDMSGNVTLQKLHNRVFDAYEAKSLVFEAITPGQQAAMMQYGGTVPPQHPAGQPVLVDNWQELLRLHAEDNLYQLLPRRAKTNASYAVMRAICASAGSPFKLDDRVDPIDYKFVFRGSDVDFRNTFNARNQDKVAQNIWFDGILLGANDAGLVMCHNALSSANVNNVAGTVNFLREWTKLPTEGDRHRQLRELWTALLTKKVHVFLGTTGVPTRDLLNYAKTKNVFVFGKRGAHYVFHA